MKFAESAITVALSVACLTQLAHSSSESEDISRLKNLIILQSNQIQTMEEKLDAAINDNNEWVGSSKNLIGPKGNTGPKGDRGVKGDKGADGARGPKGNTGPKGDNGNRGPKGDQGPRGYKGDQGPRGHRGSNAMC